MSYSDKHRSPIEQMFLNEMMEDDLDDAAIEDEYDVLMDEIADDDFFDDSDKLF